MAFAAMSPGAASFSGAGPQRQVSSPTVRSRKVPCPTPLLLSPTSSPQAATVTPSALKRLEERQQEAERLFKLQREATERLLAEQRGALEEHRRALEGSLNQLGSPQGMQGEAQRKQQPGVPQLRKPVSTLSWEDEAAKYKSKTGCDGSPKSQCNSHSDGDSDSSNSEVLLPTKAYNLLRGSWTGAGKKRRSGRLSAREHLSLKPRRSASNMVIAHNNMQECLLPILQSTWFQNFVGVLVLLNALTFGVQVHQSVRLELHSDLREDTWVDMALPKMEHAFLVAFVLEVVLRLLGEQKDFFVGINWKWNLFDSVIIAVCGVDEVHNRSGGSIAALRAVRLLRAVRIIRVFRFLRHLRLMLFSILSCLVSLMWALLLLAVVMYGFALYLGQVILIYLENNPGVDSSDPSFKCLLENWDGVPKSMRSLVFSISGGQDWADLAKPFWDINVVHGVMYTLFILFTTFGLLNIMVGVFVQEAAEILKWDRELVLEDALAKEDSREAQLKDLFLELDQDESGSISFEELAKGMEDPHIKAYFTHLNIDKAKASEFFGFLDRDQSGSVSMTEFVEGCLRFQGSAKPLEVANLLTECKLLSEKVDGLYHRMDELRLTPRFMAVRSGLLREQNLRGLAVNSGYLPMNQL